ncbi:MBL fold metallo-hydrolase [Nocardioides sp. SR21]|uniref:MBL fold metallo-hydrolase n=1 Tax=Nocardioides sp. SR21 TaxID=2919501 RepID=UPI001FAADC22|nr:MBL fold metallo-hydrolase [Nocardioides sp. SR21]
MRLTIVGSSGSYPGPDSPASCYLLEADDADGRTWRVLLDLGSGALGALHKYVDPLTIDAVLLSHLHADHCLDLSGYYVMRKYHPTGAQPRIPVYGPEGTADRMARAYDLPLDPGMHEEFDFRDWGETIELGPFSIEPIPVLHPVDAFGLRVTADGATVAYSGDTGPCSSLEDVARDADVFLAEASFRVGHTNPPDLHLTGADGGEVAARAGVKRLLLTHVPPWHDPADALAEAATTYDGPTELAVCGAVYEF